jgi:hypothetical protein
MPAAAEPVPEPSPAVDPLQHPLNQLTTYELRDHRRDLERAIAFFDRQTPVPPARDQLLAELDAVTAEQDDRARLASNA